jgi:uncharacterized repeat protein (TIGR01451 family)
LTLAVWDVDYDCGSECCERDIVYLNGNQLTSPGEYLTGNAYQWSLVSFNVDPAWIVDGNNYVEIEIDVLSCKQERWCVMCDWCELALEIGPALTKVDNVYEDDCIEPNDEITYTIEYQNPADPNLPDINDVNIIDYLPPEVDFNSASNGGVYDSNSRTVSWHIDTIEPNNSGFVTLTARVKRCLSYKPGSLIINQCRMTGNYCINSITTNENTPICDYKFFRGDINHDGVVNFVDFFMFVSHWLQTGCDACEGAELTCDNQVNFDDFARFAEYWFESTAP